MASDAYMQGEGWRELVRETVCGRPTLVWRERPRHMLDLLDLSVGRPEHDVLVQGERRRTYADFRRAIEAGAAELAAAGVRAGGRVLIVLYNSPEFLLVQWSALRLGAVPVFGNRWWSPHELAEVVSRVRPALIVTDMALASEGGETRRLTPAEVAEWWDRPPPTTPAPDPRPLTLEDDEAAIVFTAGSTGAPKGVRLSHRNLVWSQQTLHNMRGGRPVPPDSPAEQKVVLMSTPMFHNGAVVTGIGAVLDGGRIVMLTGRFDAKEVLGLIARERMTEWQAVPVMFRRVLNDPAFTDFDLASLRGASSGGAMVSLDLADEVKARLPSVGDNFVVGYGMTEASFLTMAGAAQMRARPGTVGKPLPGVEVCTNAADGTGEGEILARSGALMLGYLGADQPASDADGWYHTGDLGRLDAEGYVYVTGRLKDMVIRGGENISCTHVEAALIAHADVLEVAVTGVPDEQFGEAVAAVVYRRPGTDLDASDLARFARERLAYFCVPSRWLFRDEPLPVLPTGKIDKRRLSRDLLARQEPAHG